MHAVSSTFNTISISGSLYCEQCIVKEKLSINFSELSGTYNITFEGGQTWIQKKGYKIIIKDSFIKNLDINNKGTRKKQKIHLEGNSDIETINFINTDGIVIKDQSSRIGKIINGRTKIAK